MLMKLVRGGNKMGKGDIVVSDLIEQLNTKDRAARCAIFIWGVLIYAVAFSIFFSPNYSNFDFFLLYIRLSKYAYPKNKAVTS